MALIFPLRRATVVVSHGKAATTLAMLALLASATISTDAAAQAACPPAGAAYTIKGFTGNTEVTSTGRTHPRDGCLWKTEDGRDLWWRMGDDVRPRAAAKPGPSPVAGGGGTGPLKPGSVYRCTLPGIGMFTGAYFGIVDSKTYRNYDGKRGNYSYDAATGTLRLISGPSRGLAYRREALGNFRVLDDNGKITGGNCALNTELKIDGRW